MFAVYDYMAAANMRRSSGEYNTDFKFNAAHA